MAAEHTHQIGTPLRDAAVDPRPGDYLVPTNAGEADPHGPLVVSPSLPQQKVRPDELVFGKAASA